MLNKTSTHFNPVKKTKNRKMFP